MSRILLLGGSGFLGRHVWRAFEGAGFEDVVAVRLGPRGSGDDARSLSADLTDRSAVLSLVATVGPNVIVNCAGATVGSPAALRRMNVQLVKNVLVAIRTASAPPALVHLGSSAEYGRVPVGRPIRESDPAMPVSPYGRAKLAASQAILTSRPIAPATVLRVFNPVGLGAPAGSLLGSAIRLLRNAMAEGRDEIHLGRLDAYRDFVHVGDVADAVVAAVRAVQAEYPSRVIINVGSGQATQVRQLIRDLAAVSGFGGRIVEDTVADSSRSADVPWQQADISLAEVALRWRPTRTLVGALRDAWNLATEEG